MSVEDKKAAKVLKKKAKKEGRRVRSLDPMHYVALYIMKDRNDATNYFSEKLDIGNAEEYIKQKRESGLTDFSIMHIFLAALVRMYSQHPEMNRFIRGRRIYARNNIEIVMTVKKEMKLNADDTVVKLIYPPESTAEDVYKITNDVIRSALEANDDFEGVAKTLNKMPRFLLRIIMWFLEKLEFYGLLPKSLTSVSPFHGSLVITSLASLGIPPVYHHLYNFGNVPIFFAFGRRYKENELQTDGSVKRVTYMDYRISCDERIADGHAYSVALRYFNSLIRNPYLLDAPPESVVEDIP
ncbi:MAG: hypothetical protein IKU30_03720 [Clostridia bacterium]|nr:hypothetical protein [Clostridia bacterium]